MSNDIVDFYKEKDISPVHQDITDIQLHYDRRRKLYRQLGICTRAFDKSRVLEIGPGGIQYAFLF